MNYKREWRLTPKKRTSFFALSRLRGRGLGEDLLLASALGPPAKVRNWWKADAAEGVKNRRRRTIWRSPRLAHCLCSPLSTVTMWVSLIALGIAAVFGFNIWKGWKTGEVRLPISILIFEEFERARSPANFWGIMAFNAMVGLAALVIAFWSLWGVISYTDAPVRSLRTLDGCYEGQGLPDFMRPPHHWTMRIADGAVIGREGNNTSRISLENLAGTRTKVRLTPGIVIGGKPSTVLAGDTVSGEAYSANGLVTIALHDDWPHIMTATSCQ